MGEVASPQLVNTIEAAVKLELPSLLNICLLYLHQIEDEAVITDVLVTSVRLGLDQFTEIVTEKLLERREDLVRDPIFQSKMMTQPLALWCLYSSLVRRQSSRLISRDLWHCA